MKRPEIFRDSFKLGRLPQKGGVAELGMADGLQILSYETSEAGVDSDNELLRVKAISQIETRGRDPKRDGTGATIKKAWKRAISEADADGVLWTPVLEAIAKTADKFMYVDDELERLGEKIDARIKLVGKECGKRPMAEILEQAKNFEGLDIKAAIWENGTNIGPEEIDALFNEGSAEGLFLSLLENKNLGKKETEALVVRTFGLQGGEFQTVWANSFATSSTRRLVDKMVDFGGLDPSMLRDFENLKKEHIARMVVAHKDASLEVLEFIFSARPMQGDVKVKALLHKNAQSKAREWVGKAAENPAGLLGLWMMILKADGVTRELTDEMLSKWTPYIPGALQIATGLIEHPTVSDTDAVALGKKCENYERWSHNDKSDVRRALARRTGARADKEIWEILKSSQNQSVLIGMVEGAQDTAEFTRAVKRLRKSNANKLLQVLKELQLAPGIVPPQKLLAPVLASGDTKQRETAIGILGRWGKIVQENSGAGKPGVKR